MDDKTTRTIRARIYIVCALIAVVMALLLTGTVRRIVLAVLAVYCVGMAVYNLRKAKDDDGRE